MSEAEACTCGKPGTVCPRHGIYTGTPQEAAEFAKLMKSPEGKKIKTTKFMGLDVVVSDESGVLEGTGYKIGDIFDRDMTEEEVIKMVGEKTWKEMAPIMAGQTGEIRERKFYMYSYDLERAYKIVRAKR